MKAEKAAKRAAHKAKKTDKKKSYKIFELRKTLCVSSQIGCKLGCTFCATGTMKLEGNLYGGEVVEQLLHAERVLKVQLMIERER